MDEITKAQQQICNKYQSAFCPILPDYVVAVALQTLGKSPICGRRETKENQKDNITWFFYCGNYSDKETYQPIYAKYLAKYLPQVMPYLALAPGYEFMIDDTGYEDVWQHNG